MRLGLSLRPADHRDRKDSRSASGCPGSITFKKTDREVDEKSYVLRERSFGRVERTLALPDGINADAAQANFRSAVLTLVLPKIPEAQTSAKHIPARTR